ncbi:hypothetical protein CKO09_05180 [Chromatium weissei]|nr:hypothetical protein [Chromatium weissei]
MSQHSTVFVALSTSQNIANILPILELAQCGDQVLWIESATAKKSNWSTGACDVLRQQGVTAIHLIEVDDEPASIHRVLRQHPLITTTGNIIKLVANGGTKLQMMAAAKALNGHLDELLYNSDRVCVLERERDNQPINATFYSRHQVDLSEVLACNNREIVSSHERRVWPTTELPKKPRYGLDVDYTRDCHQRIFDWIQTHPDAPKKAFSYQQATQLAPEYGDQFQAQICKACNLEINESSKIKKRNLEALYNCAHQLDREAWNCVGDDEAPNIGRELEDAVAARVVCWLKTNPRFEQIVQSVWCNVKVRQRGKKEDVAELDTALLLKNGILLHLECKSFDAKIKDMNSRLGELQRSSSQLARIAICAPSYPVFENEKWHQALSKKTAAMREWKQFKFIAFTFPHQNDATEITFENAMTQWLESYLPTGF